MPFQDIRLFQDIRPILLSTLLAVLVGVTLPLPAVASEPGGDAGEAHWLTRVDEALALAAESDRFILVDLYADWCGWCKQLEAKVFTTPQFERFAEEYVLLRVDVEDGAEGSDLQARFGVTSLPTTLVIDANMAKVAELKGFAPAPQFIARLAAGLAEHRAFLAFYEEAKTSTDPAALRQLAADLHGRGDGLRAAEVYERVKKLTPEKSPAAEAWLDFRIADAYLLARRLGAATETFRQSVDLAAGTEDPKLHEGLDLLRYRLAHERGDCEKAKTSLVHFIDAHPQSPFLSQAKKALRSLERGTASICA